MLNKFLLFCLIAFNLNSFGQDQRYSPDLIRSNRFISLFGRDKIYVDVPNFTEEQELKFIERVKELAQNKIDYDSSIFNS